MKPLLLITILFCLTFFSACSREADTRVYGDGSSGEEGLVAPLDFSAANISAENSGITEVLDYFDERLEKAPVSFESTDIYNPYENVPPDETGSVIIVMFHNFVEEYEEGGDRKITTTLFDFRKLLERLYSEGYRSVPLSDFINGSIALRRGCKPIVFTFDDGRPSQFNFIENSDGTLTENPNTAIGVMEQFYREYPEFGLNGTFFLNLGAPSTFGTAGTLKQRLEAVAAKGFELENHSLYHGNLAGMHTAEQIEAEIGGNAKLLNDILPGRTMSVLALPYGNSAVGSLASYMEKGEYEGLEYRNKAIMLVGAEPAKPMYLNGSDTLKVRRVLADGMDPVECDLSWWLARDYGPFISDGNPDTVSVPADKLGLIDGNRILALRKELVIVENKAE